MGSAVMWRGIGVKEAARKLRSRLWRGKVWARRAQELWMKKGTIQTQLNRMGSGAKQILVAKVPPQCAVQSSTQHLSRSRMQLI